MRRVFGLALSIALCLGLFVVPSYAGTIIAGGAPDVGTGNAFPFTYKNPLPDGATVGRYQQVYSSDLFSEAVLITGVSFFNTQYLFVAAEFAEADYAISFSTVTQPGFGVNALDVVDLDNNVGPDAAAFAAVHLAGLTGSTFMINAGSGGGGAFLYDPSQGDLLIDIVRTDHVAGTGKGFLDSNFHTSAGAFSRATNYSPAAFASNPANFADSGLRTEFTIQAIPEPASLTIFGLGALCWSASAVRSRLGRRGR